MAKTYVDTVKYIIRAEFEVSGLVDKPDVVGAIFGQTEGLMGDELDLRELQKSGRIGRIEVMLQSRSGKTYGTITVPSSLDMVETSIIAAALEVVDRIGPCEGKIKVIKIEDTRNEKRKRVVERAQELLKEMLAKVIPESKEISQMVREQVRATGIITYGPDQLPAGPAVPEAEEIILVEGRADVINLLKNNINNALGIGGARIPPSLVEISKKKEVTLFLDGDRGGDIILQELIQAGVEIDYIARAPVGKEVEELTRKEIIKALRGKTPFEQEAKKLRKPAFRKTPVKVQAVSIAPRAEPTPSPAPPAPKPALITTIAQPSSYAKPEETPPQSDSASSVQSGSAPKKERKAMGKEVLLEELAKLENTLQAKFFDSEGKEIATVPVRDVIKALRTAEEVKYIVFDGIITQRLVDLAKEKGVKAIAGLKIGNVSKKPAQMELVVKG